MAKCKLCKVNISDGTEYCSSCLDKKHNETYLDSLLNSVKNTVPNSGGNYKKSDENGPTKEKTKEEQQKKQAKPKKADADNQEDKVYNFNDLDSDMLDLEDLSDYEQFNITDDLDDNIIIGDEDLYGIDLDDYLNDNLEDDASEEIASFDLDVEKKQDKKNNKEQASDVVDYKLEQTVDEDVQITPSEDFIANEELPQSDTLTDIQSEDTLQNNINPTEIEQYEDMDTSDPALSGLLNDLYDDEGEEDNDGSLSSQEEAETTDLANSSDIKNKQTNDNVSEENKAENKETEDIQDDNAEPDIKASDEIGTDNIEEHNDEADNIASDNLGTDDIMADSTPTEISDDVNSGADDFDPDNFDPEEEEDLLSLLSQINSDDPVTSDIQAISELLSGDNNITQADNETPIDVGDVFSDALKVVSSLDDPDEAVLQERLNATDKDREETDNKKQKKKGRKKKKAVADEDKDGQDTPKKGILSKLFGNVVDEKSKSVKSEKASKEESAASSEKKKKSKKSKKSDAQAADADNSADSDNQAKKKGQKKAEKKEKKEKKKKDKEIIQVIDEIDEDEGRINRVGASIVFIFFGLLVTIFLIGTNVFSYTLSIKNAQNYFDRNKYNQAYNEVYGIEIEDKDMELYDKIMTVMFVNKQLNSYNSYYAIKKYPEALDALLKGLQRYEKYIQFATIIGIKSDLDYVRDQLIYELDNVFQLSEAEAYAIISSESQVEYSIEVYDVVLENMNININ
ncbi:hypothetical protein I5677_02065 [Mobilitalea sibirica]|uniref:Uncharacterized protein n=1 Tax=Mobilitalea sibirica TaxID=1462919 RepID=A0A8J7H0N3_9FIRM|nr:hypothetical protein [Mobilitalea sibirica]MBH1939677.1 hypothetical protein [Mobilitalea sibirica]